MLSTTIRNKKKFYKKRDYSNPFFNKEKKHGRTNKIFNLKFFKILTFFLIIFFIWISFFSNYFTIKNIEIVGEGSHVKEIKDLAWQQVNLKTFFVNSQRNIFLFSINDLTASLNNNYFFNRLAIKKDFPESIIIDFEEKKYSLIWIEGPDYYFIDLDGSIIDKVATSSESLPDYPIIENKANKSVDGKKITNRQKEIEYANNLYNEFKNSNFNFLIERFIVDYDINTLKVVTNRKTMIYFNIEDSLAGQISKLKILIDGEIKDTFGHQDYIDLRYGDRIYYK